ncbi:MFS transporter [Lactobacillaceae bacterium L1_55_11]|nr:MFS transporter [Lactobacillaceae bacterium L1_55_11]
MIALLGLMQGLPAALGPSLGGIITQWLSWHWLFFINVPLVVVIVVIAAKSLAKQPRVTDLHLDLTGSFLSIITLASLTTMLVQGRIWGWQSRPTLGFASLSIIAFGLFLYCERHQPDPMIPLNLFKNRQFVGAAIVIVLSSFFLVATTVILPNYYVNVMGQTTFEASLMITPITAMIFFLSPVSGFSLEKLGPRTLLATGFILMLLSYYGYGFTNALSNSGSAMIAGALIGAGYGLIVGPTTVLAAANFTGTLLSCFSKRCWGFASNRRGHFGCGFRESINSQCEHC